MDGAGRQDRVDAAAFGGLDSQLPFLEQRLQRGGVGFLRLAGRQHPADPARWIGQSGHDGMHSPQPRGSATPAGRAGRGALIGRGVWAMGFAAAHGPLLTL